jgi:hypothetical protein
MAPHDPHHINRLVSDFMDLQEAWERAPDAFDWNALQSIVEQGAQAYNEGYGPSFHSLALDGVRHSVFHERFLDALLRSGFDPFKLASVGTQSAPIPVLDHALLAEMAHTNASSARMRSALLDLARKRFEPLAQEVESGKNAYTLPLFDSAKACAESIPDDLLLRIAPELVSGARGDGGDTQGAKEGYLTQAELQLERSWRPHG